MTDMDKFDSVKPFYEYLKILPFKDNMKLLQGTFMWKLVNAVHPNSISEKFPLTYSQAINNHQNKLVIPYCHRAVSKGSLAYTAYKLWNHYLYQKFGMDRHTGSSLWWINVEVD